MSAPEQGAPPSYEDNDSLAVRPLSQLPVYTFQEEATVASSVIPIAALPQAPLSVPRASLTPPSLHPKEYTYEIKNHRSKPWAILTLLADPRLSRTTSTFLEGSSITGSVKLSLPSRDHIESLVIFVRGDLVTSGDPEERLNFFRLRKFIWTTAMGNPREQSTTGVKWEEKLYGEYLWQFSIKIPTFPNEPGEGENGEQFRLPHSFAERFSRASIKYYLELRINRGKFRTDDRLITQFGYFSMQQPDPPSPLRQLAYQNHTDLPGPYLDPDGWHALESVQIRGTIFGARAVDAKCTVFLAKPLCYTRATSIPCAITIETEDEQAADLLASMKSSAVYLQRCVRCTFGGSTNDIIPCGQAIWWPPSDGTVVNPLQRYIVGQIPLRKDLQPSTAIKRFRVEYAIVVFPPAVVSFKPESKGPLITHRVEIVTRFAQGPRPKVASRPVYEPNDAFVDRYYESLPTVSPRSG